MPRLVHIPRTSDVRLLICLDKLRMPGPSPKLKRQKSQSSLGAVRSSGNRRTGGSCFLTGRHSRSRFGIGTPSQGVAVKQLPW